MTSPRRCIITLVAFVWLFSTVRFQMSFQTECMSRCKITLVAFVWSFPTMRFQMFPQIVCMRRCIVTLIACVWLYYILCLILKGFCIYKGLFHCHCALCVAEIVILNWDQFKCRFQINQRHTFTFFIREQMSLQKASKSISFPPVHTQVLDVWRFKWSKPKVL